MYDIIQPLYDQYRTYDYAPLMSATHDNTAGVDLHCAVEVNIETDAAGVFADINIIINI